MADTGAPTATGGPPVDPGGGPRIDHLVVLMLENHSFDHLLGFLRHPAAGFDGLTPGRFSNPDGQGVAVPVSADGVPWGVDPDHSHEGALAQIGRAGDVATNGGFVRSYETVAGPGEGGVIMRCLDPDVHCPALATLAREFALCTGWFSSLPGETWPNRNFAHAATSGGTVNIEGGLYYDRTIFELLGKHKATWRIYYDGTPEVWCYPRLWRPTTFVDFLLRRRSRIGNWFESVQFADHARRGDLATYSFIEPAHNGFYSPAGAPRRTNSQHPHNNAETDDDFRAGDALIASVYESLRANPDLFARTLLVVTYDEHGGLYDHVRPPATFPPADHSWRGLTRRLGAWLRALADRRAHRPTSPRFDFRRLGVRVPTVLVSPWIAPHTLVPEVLEHASLPATLRALFAPDAAPLTNRDRHAATFAAVVAGSGLARPRPAPGHAEPGGPPPVPDLGGLAADRPGGGAPLAAPSPGAVPSPGPPAAPGTSASPVATGAVDRELVALAARVEAKLRRHPTTVAARRRAARAGATEALAARTGEVFPADQAVSLFRASAKTARRRPVTRPPG
ncbi:MAG: alkaline phosphatase family protein [Acidimicrobiales bacterium]